MDKLFRQTIYFLVITFVINAVGWTFNKEAIADVWFGEQHRQAEDDGHSSSEPEERNTVPSESPCNHWCYTVGHFIGMLSPMGFMTLEFANTYSVQRTSTIQLSASDVRFRPPRLLSKIRTPSVLIFVLSARSHRVG